MTCESRKETYRVSQDVEVLVGPPREEGGHGVGPSMSTPLTFRGVQKSVAPPLEQAPDDLRNEILDSHNRRCLELRGPTVSDQINSI